MQIRAGLFLAQVRLPSRQGANPTDLAMGSSSDLKLASRPEVAQDASPGDRRRTQRARPRTQELLWKPVANWRVSAANAGSPCDLRVFRVQPWILKPLFARAAEQKVKHEAVTGISFYVQTLTVVFAGLASIVGTFADKQARKADEQIEHRRAAGQDRALFDQDPDLCGKCRGAVRAVGFLSFTVLLGHREQAVLRPGGGRKLHAHVRGARLAF